MTSTLMKLGAIANFADKNGDYDAANQFTTIIREAQLFDALKTLFDPSSSELDLNSGFWKRLTRGWQRGKFDRRLGLALAINAERTKLNKKIEMLAQPLKDFSAQVSAFYDKVKSGGENYGAMDFRAELSQLKTDAAKMKNLIGGKDLRKALDMRNKLNSQQISAVEKIKGIDPEHKDFLVKLLNGEIKQAPETVTNESAKENNKEEVPGATTPGFGLGNKRTPEQRAIGEWLGLQKIPAADYDEGFHGSRSQGRAAQIFQRYGYNPIAVLEFFKQHPEKKREGVELFGTRFRKLFEDLNWAVELEEAKKKEDTKVLPPSEVVSPAKETTPVVAPSPVSVEKPTPVAPKKPSELELDLADARKVQKAEKAIERRKAKNPAVESKPEEKTPRIADIPLISPASDLAVSTAARTAREITRFGRVQQLKKLAAEPDMYEVFPEGREQYDEEKDYDPTQTGVDMYHGEQEEEAMRGSEDDEDGSSWGWRNKLRHREKQDTLNSLLLKMEQFGRLWRKAPDEGTRALIQKQLDRLQAEYDLLEEKARLEKEKKLPEGWADDGQ